MTTPAKTPKGLAAALLAVQAELPIIPKTEKANVEHKDGGHHSYTYAGLGQITKLLMPLLTKHGLTFSARPTMLYDERDGEWPQPRFVLVYRLMHAESSEHETGEWPLPMGRHPQAIGSEITYARRYVLCALTGVAPEDDDDDAAAAARPRQQASYPEGGEPHARDRGRPDQPSGRSGPRHASQGQLTRIHILFNDIGITKDKRADGLTYIAGVVGREVGSSKELTVAEANKVMHALEADIAERQQTEAAAEQDAEAERIKNLYKRDDERGEPDGPAEPDPQSSDGEGR